MGLVVQASLAAGHQNMAQAMVLQALQAWRAGLLCRPGVVQGSSKYRLRFWIKGLVVQASSAAGQQTMVQAMFNTGLLCRLGGSGLLCRPGGLQGSTRHRQSFLIRWGFLPTTYYLRPIAKPTKEKNKIGCKKVVFPLMFSIQRQVPIWGTKLGSNSCRIFGSPSWFSRGSNVWFRFSGPEQVAFFGTSFIKKQ